MTRDEALLAAIDCARESRDRLGATAYSPECGAAYAQLGQLYAAIAAQLPTTGPDSEAGPDVAQCGHGVMSIRDGSEGWLHVMSMDLCGDPPATAESW